jgi:hypothetical protein
MTQKWWLEKYRRYLLIAIVGSSIIHLIVGGIIRIIVGPEEKTVTVRLKTYDAIKPPIRYDAQPPRFIKSFALAKEVAYTQQTMAREIKFTRSEVPRSTTPANSRSSGPPSGGRGGGEGSVFFGALTAGAGASELGWGLPGGAQSYGRSFGVGGSGGWGAGPGDGKDWGPQFASDVENTRSTGGGGLSAMKDELISYENFSDRFDGWFEVNPRNKKDIKGFLNIYQLQYNSTRLEKAPTDNKGVQIQGWIVVDNQPSWNCVPQALQSLAQYANDSTKLSVQIRGTVRLDSKELNTIPFLFMMGFQAAIKYSKEEARTLGHYLKNGGFLFIDDGNAYQPGAFNQSVRQMLRDALGYEAVFERVPASHQLFHSFEDFSGPPSGDDMVRYDPNVRAVKEIYQYVEAIFINGRMVALVSNRGYCFAWGYWKYIPPSAGGPYDNQRQLQFGLNVIVYALGQRGGIVDQNRTRVASEQRH